MTTLIDARFNALRDQGYTGSTSDMLLQWLKASGATSNNINDAWYQFLSAEGYSGGHRNDSWYAYLRDQGYQGSLSDMELAFWVAGGAPGYGPELVVNGGFDTAGVGNCTAASNALLTNTSGALEIKSNGSSTGFHRGEWLGLMDTGKSYRVAADIVSYSGQNRFYISETNSSEIITETGYFERQVTYAGGDNGVGFGGYIDSSAEIVVDNVSVKEVL